MSRVMGSRLRRPVTFALVGGLCFAVQYGILTGLAATGVGATFANAAGFLISAQLNFVLSAAVTWGDRRVATAGGTLARWASYQATAGLALAVYVAVFAISVGTLGSLAATAYVAPDGMLVGIELNCTHHRAAREGLVTGVCEPLYHGTQVGTYQVTITDENDRLICTARLTCLLRKSGGTDQ